MKREREITEALIAWCQRCDVNVDLEGLTDLVDLVKRLSAREGD
jgi:hypothetical protein|tara:strand:- start:467 stop:598 length:132 start_codon:yes stop_codon:yes gene_type:complete